MSKCLILFLTLSIFCIESFGQNKTNPDKSKKESSKKNQSKTKKEEKSDPMSGFEKEMLKEQDASEIKVIEVQTNTNARPGKKGVDAQSDHVYDQATVQEQAEFPGGMQGLMEFLSAEIKYPKECLEKEISGKVYVEFVVNQKGKIGQVKVKRGVDPLLDAEAVRVVAMFPDWKPAKNMGKIVSQSYTLPIRFQIPPKEEEKK
jgi:TonB family protein